eukprot:COSAG05_NODE_13003_length_445_cov_0.890173_1_plen_60_part_10
MEKRSKFLDQKIAAELQKAKEESRKKNKRGAMMALKKKKLYEKVRLSTPRRSSLDNGPA